MQRLEGGCLCGSIRYTVKGEPLGVIVCHCRHCQKQTGTSFSILLIVAETDFELTGDSLAAYNTIADSGNTVIRRFCRLCGSPIYSEVQDSHTNNVVIKAGTLDDTSHLQPDRHIWQKRSQVWLKDIDGFFQEGFFDVEQ